MRSQHLAYRRLQGWMAQGSNKKFQTVSWFSHGNQMIVEAGQPPKISRNCNASSLLTGPKPFLGFPSWMGTFKNKKIALAKVVITMQHMSQRRSASKRLTNRQAMTAARAEYFMALIHSNSDGKFESPRQFIDVAMCIQTHTHIQYIYILCAVCTK